MRAFSEREIATSLDTFADVELQLGRREAIGGETWNVFKTGSGDGVTGPVGADVAAGQVIAYVQLSKPSALAQALAGTQVESEQWTITAPESELAANEDNEGLREGRTLQSVTEPSLVFRITSLDPLNGYVSGNLERV